MAEATPSIVPVNSMGIFASVTGVDNIGEFIPEKNTTHTARIMKGNAMPFILLP
jgi:hypothetical protein